MTGELSDCFLNILRLQFGHFGELKRLLLVLKQIYDPLLLGFGANFSFRSKICPRLRPLASVRVKAEINWILFLSWQAWSRFTRLDFVNRRKVEFEVLLRVGLLSRRPDPSLHFSSLIFPLVSLATSEFFLLILWIFLFHGVNLSKNGQFWDICLLVSQKVASIPLGDWVEHFEPVEFRGVVVSEDLVPLFVLVSKHAPVGKVAILLMVESFAILGLEIGWFGVGSFCGCHHKFLLSVSKSTQISVATKGIFNEVIAQFALVLGRHLLVWGVLSHHLATLSGVVRGEVVKLRSVLGLIYLSKWPLKGNKGGCCRLDLRSELGDS